MKTIGNEPINAIKEIGVAVKNNNEVFIPFTPESAQFDANFSGLTKREYFATMAMQGMLSNNHGFTTDTGVTATSIDQKARFCTLMADALIEALNK